MVITLRLIGRSSLVGSDAFWDASESEIYPRVQHMLSRRFGHEKFSSSADSRRTVVS